MAGETMPTPQTAPPIIPIEYAGLWIAWSQDRTRIVASGHTLDDAIRAAEATSEKEPSYEKAPKANVRFVGGLRS
jgi:hypothetical protein